MNAFEQIALAWQSMLRTLAELRHPATWAPWLVVGAVQFALILLLWNFAHPWLSSWMAPLVIALGGEAATHYPGLFRALPSMYSTADLVIGALLGSVAIGAATRVFAGRFLARPVTAGASFAEAARRSLALILAQLPFHLIALGIGLGLGGWLESQKRSAMVRILGTVFVIGGSIVVQSLFFYVAALVILEKRSAWSALAEVPRTWKNGFWAATFLGVVLLLALTPFELLQSQSGLVADRGRPELIAGLTLLQAAVTLLLYYTLTGSATMIYLASMARRDDES